MSVAALAFFIGFAASIFAARNPGIISPLIPAPAFSRRETSRVSLTPGAIIAPLQGAEIFPDLIQGRRTARLPLATFCRRFAAG